MTNSTSCFIPFPKKLQQAELPKKFTFPFFYNPHPLAIYAAEQLQDFLNGQQEITDHFDPTINTNKHAIGKMFGVLVVQNKQGELGYLYGFSGKLADKNRHEGFVPPVFDMLIEANFFNNGMKEITQINERVKKLENQEDYLDGLQELSQLEEQAKLELEKKRLTMVEAKKDRRLQRNLAKDSLPPSKFELLKEKLITESLNHKFHHNQLKIHWEEKINASKNKTLQITTELKTLKESRKIKSNGLQQLLFENYTFLNSKGTSKSLKAIFENKLHHEPPAGAGECAAPKLLQYAYRNELKPIALAEFWWGKSPKSEVRKHGQFYPACYGKCKPILGHMLEGIELDDNPFLVNHGDGKKITTFFEDDDLAVINKPEGLLSVPGSLVEDSVYMRMKEKYPLASGPLIVHRLDMQTSGIMLIAKTKNAHKKLQNQFIKRTISKRYIAILDGLLKEQEGSIDLPLRVDFDDRPRQMVCYEHGKSAQTQYKVISQTNEQTRIAFTPITGRTHQLRMHSAHSKGLNTPILGDDLYGKSNTRLYLHAEYIKFKHPTKKIELDFTSAPDF